MRIEKTQQYKCRIGGNCMRVSWPEVLEEIYSCEKCRLRATCTHVVPGEGSPNADIMFVGEGPGQDEDRLGRPFVGASGQLLTQMIHAIGMERTEVYIANVVKCRPPHNRNPEPDEVQACLPHLRAQFALIRPKIVVLLGRVPLQALLGGTSIMRERGVWQERKGTWFMPTFHPSFLLRDPSQKRAAWEDFKQIRDKLAELKAAERGE